VLSCTGATASRNYLPGLTEAWYRKLPVIAITSTPSLAAVGHLMPQCIDRSVSQNDIAKIRVTIPTVKDKEDFWACEVKVNNALLEARRAGGGPVHINLGTTGHGTFNARELPAVRVIRRIGYSDEIPTIDVSTKVAVFVGSHKPFTRSETEAFERFVNTHTAVVLCDHTSSYRGAGRVLSALACSQDLLTKPNFAAMKPDLIIHVGEVSGDYATQGFAGAFAAKVWRVNEDGELRDRFGRLEYVFEMREQDFFRRLSEDLSPRENSYARAWREYTEHVATMIPELPFSNTWIAKELSRALPCNATVHFGILNSLRNWNFFEVDETIQTAANVGGFGIDGAVSTLLGASLAHKDRLYFGVFGDLAFFYDLNSIGNRHLGSNLRILLINNGGGGEFNLYRHIGAQFGDQVGDFIAAAGHYGNKSPILVKHVAQDLGFEYLAANNKEEFRQVAHKFAASDAQDKPILLECFTDFADDSNALEALERLDTAVSTRSVAVNMARKVLPQGVKDAIKKALR
jgi:2-succinyl-5-enolpyruvyl-6-hydroxy-3-cyclohexene-1-carboxylate synthase